MNKQEHYFDDSKDPMDWPDTPHPEQGEYETKEERLEKQRKARLEKQVGRKKARWL